MLDFQKVKPSERSRAERLASSAAGAALESDVQVEAQRAAAGDSGGAKTFEPGEGLGDEGGHGGRSIAAANFSKEEKEQIRDLLANAKSAKELEEIENFVRRGVLPPALSSRKRPAPTAATDEGTAAPTANGGTSTTNHDEEPVAKRRQT